MAPYSEEEIIRQAYRMIEESNDTLYPDHIDESEFESVITEAAGLIGKKQGEMTEMDRKVVSMSCRIQQYKAYLNASCCNGVRPVK